jgi:hypothetical protein
MTTPDGHRCEVITDEQGNMIATAHVSPNITDAGRAALADLIDVVRRQFEADLAADPTIGERQEASQRRIRERNRWLGISPDQ